MLFRRCLEDWRELLSKVCDWMEIIVVSLRVDAYDELKIVFTYVQVHLKIRTLSDLDVVIFTFDFCF